MFISVGRDNGGVGFVAVGFTAGRGPVQTHGHIAGAGGRQQGVACGVDQRDLPRRGDHAAALIGATGVSVQAVGVMLSDQAATRCSSRSWFGCT